MNSGWKWTVPGENGLPGGASSSSRADRLIHAAIEEGLGEWLGTPQSLTRSGIQKAIEEGRLRVDGKAIKASVTIPPGSLVELNIPPAAPLALIPEDRPIEILYEDEHLVIVNKPQGLTVHPSETQSTGTLVHALLHHVRDLSGIGGVLRPGIVHRIDKDTSGAIVITKTDLAHQRLAKIFAAHDIERKYWALCYGAPLDAFRRELKIESLIGRNPADRKKMSMEVKEGRKAVTWVTGKEAYALPRQAPFASWVEARLETGRTHQLRVHLTGLGHSILGDPTYGTPSDRHTKWMALPPEVRAAVNQLPGQALHARVLGFEHPITGRPLRFEAEPPAEFHLLLTTLQGYR